jgi:hypothetical protein
VAQLITKQKIVKKMRISWNITEIRAQVASGKLDFDGFYKLCKGQYKAYYKNVKKEEIAAEFEQITNTKIK